MPLLFPPLHLPPYPGHFFFWGILYFIFLFLFFWDGKRALFEPDLGKSVEITLQQNAAFHTAYSRAQHIYRHNGIYKRAIVYMWHREEHTVVANTSI